MYKAFIFSLAAFVSAAAIASCGDPAPPKPDTAALLPGYWQLTTAIRNQKPTQTLNGTFFEFTADGQMSTNLPIGLENETTPYELKANTIQQKGGIPLTYQITTISDSQLVLQTEIQGMTFELQLAKGLAPSEALPVDSLEE